MIRALSSTDQRRRRPVPVITSTSTNPSLRLKTMLEHTHKPISKSHLG